MRIALDYDDTFTRDMEFWYSFIRLARQHGHEVVCVTMRMKETGAPGMVIPVIYTDGEQKRPYCESRGEFFHVWIDDTPEFIPARGSFPGNSME